MVPFVSVGFDATDEALAVIVNAGYVREFPSGLDEILKALRGLGATGESVRILREAGVSDVKLNVGRTLSYSAKLPSPELDVHLYFDPAAGGARLSIQFPDWSKLEKVFRTLGLEKALERDYWSPHTGGFPSSSSNDAIRFPYIVFRH